MSVSLSLDTNTRREAALRLLSERVDYERTLVVPYRGRQFRLRRIRELLTRLGNPQRGLPIIHIAGTKGKGSTAAMMAAVLTAAGYRTGLFTSPHLDRVEERIAINGRACSAEDLVDLVDRVRPAVEAMDQSAAARQPAECGPTFFETTTALAFLHFAACKADAVVLEVGLGGRLDATNVCRPQVSIITSISLDHTRELGNTLEAIAREKAGIVKPGVPVISGVVDSGPREVIRQVCRRRRSRLIELGVDFDFRYHPPRDPGFLLDAGKVDFCARGCLEERAYRGIPLRLLGHHQAANAAVALAALAQLQEGGWRIPEEAIRSGLEGLVWPARVEIIARQPAVVIDGAHNVASVAALIRVLNEHFSAPRRLLVFAATQGKDVRGMLEQLVDEFDTVILTRYLDNPRAVPLEELVAVATELTGGRRLRVCPGPAEAWDHVRALAAPEDLICITGSFFIAAQMRRHALARPAE